jgi:sirohydrochlorin cobaltochelatase
MARADTKRAGLLLAAHGERRDGAENESITQIAATLTARGIAAEISFGFLRATPTIAEAINAMTSSEIVVYPMFMSDGFFTRVRLPQALEMAKGKPSIRILPPLGFDPALGDLIRRKAQEAATERGFATESENLVLVAHGSSNDPASRIAAQTVAKHIETGRCFVTVRVALLEEPPSLADVLAEISGPTIVVGLFIGDGLHGGHDMPALLRESHRDDLVFAGNVGAYPEIADLVAAAFRR